MTKYCTRCGKPFDAVGREVICPACKAAAAEETKRAAVLRAKRASWTGESVPVRISGRASTVIRAYGTAHNLPFASALDALLQASDYVMTSGKAWEDITPYRSRRRDKPATEQVIAEDTQDVQDTQDEPAKSAAKPAKTAAKPVKSASKAAASKASKASKAAASKASKAKAASK